MKRFVTRPLISALCASGLLGLTLPVFASGFQLWEQDGATIGNYHAGYAAEGDNASIAFYNPAGIMLFQNQQIVAGADGIMSSFKYKGNVGLSTSATRIFLPPPGIVTFNNVTAQGGTYNTVPFLHYVAPINDRWGFGFSVDAPFGLDTNYGNNTPLQYAATLSSLEVIDVSPDLAFNITHAASLGLGLDVQKAYAELNGAGTLGIPPTAAYLFNTPSTNKANDTGYGYHAGILYQFSPDTRVGLSYHSQVVHHLTGSSTLQGPLVALVTGGGATQFRSANASANITLPPYTALSAFHRINDQFAVMGSAIYTQWSTLKQIGLRGVAGIVGVTPTIINVAIPQYFDNSWNFSVGTNYYVTQHIMLRAGLGYDQTPVPDAYRNVRLPDNSRFVVALGGHFEATKTVSFDLGWTHFFMNQATVNPPTSVTGSQFVTTNGNVNGGADVLGGQVVWNIV